MLRHWVNGGCFLFFKCHINQWKKTLLQTLILPNVPSINNEGRCARKLHSFINMFLHIFPMLTWTHCHNHTFALIIKDLFWAQNCLLWLNISVLKMNYYIQFTYTSSLEERKAPVSLRPTSLNVHFLLANCLSAVFFLFFCHLK